MVELRDYQVNAIDALVSTLYILGSLYVANIYDPGTILGYEIAREVTVGGFTFAVLTVLAIGSFIINIYTSDVSFLEPLFNGNAKAEAPDLAALAGLGLWVAPFLDQFSGYLDGGNISIVYVLVALVIYGYVAMANNSLMGR